MTEQDIKQLYQNFIYLRTYSRWIEREGRRETWDETVDRYYFYLRKRVPTSLASEFSNACDAIRRRKVMPSMRLLWTAGVACDVDNISAYNCSYTPIDKPKRFSEILYILMNGVGVGFSVEREYIRLLPVVQPATGQTTNIIVEDSKEGWATATDNLFTALWSGHDVTWDVSKVRPKGARLNTFGGRASGAAPLVEMFVFAKAMFKNATGRRLHSIEVLDLVCKIAQIVIVGGVRRSATICFSNLSDGYIRRAKDGEYWINPNTKQRGMANISVAYSEKPDVCSFMEEWVSLMKSGTGERGIVNLNAFPSIDMRLNPCAERALMPQQLCNLSEVVVTSEDTLESLAEKVKFATILGTVQATLTKFNTNIISQEWVDNTKKDAMLGVSLTGIASLEVSPDYLHFLRNVAVETNKQWADALGINTADGITCVKPSGTVSQLVGCTSGIHPEYADFYIRRVRVAATDPLCKLLRENNVPNNPEVDEQPDSATTYVFDFPVRGTAKRVKATESAITQLEQYKKYKLHWCDARGNPSCTVYVKDTEWLDVGAWVYQNWEYVGGLSFLPADGGVYQLAPYEEITEEQFNKLVSAFPDTVDFSKLVEYELEDATQGAKEYSCSAGQCELV